MSSQFLDSDSILSCNEQWQELDEKWGQPVDLETEEHEEEMPRLKPVFSTLDLRTTFDSPLITKKAKTSKKSVIEYKEFLQDLQLDNSEIPKKQFYYIGGQILSAFSVEAICDKIDDIFKSVEKLCSATSTICRKNRSPEVVHCSISFEDLSYDDTVESEKEKHDSDDVNRYIDEAFDQLNCTIATMVRDEEITRDSVTTLVRKFSSILNGSSNLGPRRKRQCSERFRNLAQFWSSAFDVKEVK